MQDLGRRRFQIDTCLGRGGFGEVYLARMVSQGGLESDVAVKVLHEDLDARGQAVERLRDEGRLLARLDHPTILRVHDLVLLEGRVALVTEYIDGQDLGEVTTGPHRIPIRALLEAIGAVAGALHAAYNAPLADGKPLELVHRDIKPSNIRIGRHGVVKLLDFGIARTDTVEREAKTQTNLMVGSPAYMAPERFLEDGAEPPADIFALGCSLYEGLVGERLFGDLPVPLMAGMAVDRNRFDDYLEDRLGLVPDEVPRAVEDLLRDTLAYDPRRRPTALRLMRRCEDLEEQVGGPSLARWARERPWPTPEPSKGALDGRELTEGTLARSSPLAPVDPVTVHDPTASVTVPRPRRGGLALLLAGVFATGMLVLVGGGVLATGWSLGWFGGGEEPPPVPDHVDAAPPEPEPVRVDEPVTVEPADLPEPVLEVEESAPAPVPEPVREVAPAAAAPVPEPAPVAPPPAPRETRVPVAMTGSVAVDLVRGGRRYSLPAEVPPGAYAVQARFNGRDFRDAGELVVVEGGAHTVECSARWMRCQAH